MDKFTLYIFLFLLGFVLICNILSAIRDTFSKFIENKYHIKATQSENEDLNLQICKFRNELTELQKKYAYEINSLDTKYQAALSENSSLQEKLRNYRLQHNTIIEDLHSEHSDRISQLNDALTKLAEKEKALAYYKTLHQKREATLNEILSSNVKSLPFLAGVISDYMTYDLEILAKQLDWGSDQKRLKKVADIREIRRDAKQRIEESKLAFYQLEYLKQLFPSLEEYIETDYIELPSELSADKFLEHDYRKDYLSKEEWSVLSEAEKNQLVLDRYIESHSKTKWQIGRDYELYVGYSYFSRGYEVEYYGTIQKLEDMGRDLIVKKDKKTAIVQCKYWSSNKLIHEKHIAQLYGTTISYCIENNLPFDSVTAILITNTTLSDVAKQMALHLNVRYKENFKIDNFPRIKCNIGKDEHGAPTKIYHLPVDQQYDSVKLKHEGEFLAFTVKEAEDAGFRHAYKWRG